MPKEDVKLALIDLKLETDESFTIEASGVIKSGFMEEVTCEPLQKALMEVSRAGVLGVLTDD